MWNYWTILIGQILLSYLLNLFADFILKLSLLKFSLFNLVLIGNFCFEILEKLVNLIFALLVFLFQLSFLNHQLHIWIESFEHTT